MSLALSEHMSGDANITGRPAIRMGAVGGGCTASRRVGKMLTGCFLYPADGRWCTDICSS